MKVSIDVGYSQVKAISETGKKILFPSVKTNDPTAGRFKTRIGHKVEIHSFRSKRYELVGEAAIQSQSATSTLSREKSIEMHDLFILTALYLCGASGINQIAVGLPLAFYRFQKDELKSRLEGLNAQIQVNDGEKRHISVSIANVYPQGAGVLLSDSLDVVKNGQLGLIDIGYYITNYLMFELVDGLPYPIAELCGSVDLGIHLVAKAIADFYQEKTGAIAPKFLLNDIIIDKPIMFQGKRLGIMPISIYERVAQQITQEVLTVWGKQADLVNQTILAGGGSILLKQFLPFTNTIIPADPVFANAEGFLLALKSQQEAK